MEICQAATTMIVVIGAATSTSKMSRISRPMPALSRYSPALLPLAEGVVAPPAMEQKVYSALPSGQKNGSLDQPRLPPPTTMPSSRSSIEISGSLDQPLRPRRLRLGRAREVSVRSRLNLLRARRAGCQKLARRKGCQRCQKRRRSPLPRRLLPASLAMAVVVKGRRVVL